MGEKDDLEMKGHPSIGTNAFLASAESPKILSSFGGHIVVKLNHEPAFKLSSYAYVQEAPWSSHSSSLELKVWISSAKLSKVLDCCISEILESSLK